MTRAEAENGRADTERADGRYREHGAEYETAVAACGKEAQAQRRSAGNPYWRNARPRDGTGRAHAAEGNGRETAPVAVQETDEASPPPASSDAHGMNHGLKSLSDR